MPLPRERPLILFMTLQWLTAFLVLSYRPRHSSAASNQAAQTVIEIPGSEHPWDVELAV